MNYWSVSGLVLDILGVLLLGTDLIRLQKALRNRAKANRAMYDELEQEYGGVESWMDELSNQTMPTSVPRHSGDSLTGYSMSQVYGIVDELAQGSSAVATRLAQVGKLLDAGARQDERLSASSLWFSYGGLGLLVIGFTLQIIGAQAGDVLTLLE